MKSIRLAAAFLFLLSSSIAYAVDPLNGQASIRITLVPGVPLTSTDDVSGTLYLEPHKGSQVSVFDGVSTWTPLQIPPATVSLSAAGLAPNTNYDVYLTTCSGSPCMTWSAAWSNDTTPPARAMQDGVEVAAADKTKRLIGAVRITSIAGQIADTHTQRFMSNRYNDEPRRMHVVDPATTWDTCSTTPGTSYCSGTAFQLAHNNTDNKLDYIVVVPRPIWAHAQAAVMSSTGAGAMLGIGIDGSMGDVALIHQQASIPASLTSNSFQTSATYGGTPGIGHHTALWLEHKFTAGTQTWLGYIPPWQISGLIGEVSN